MADMREMDQALVLTAWRSRADKWHYNSPCKVLCSRRAVEPWCFSSYFNPFPIPNDSHLQIVYLMADVPRCQFLGACHSAKQWLLITDVCVETKQDRLCIGP